MAVGDAVAGAEAMDEAVLRGVLLGMSAKAKDEDANAKGLPAGVIVKDEASAVQTQDERIDFYAKTFSAARGDKESK